MHYLTVHTETKSFFFQPAQKEAVSIDAHTKPKLFESVTQTMTSQLRRLAGKARNFRSQHKQPTVFRTEHSSQVNCNPRFETKTISKLRQ